MGLFSSIFGPSTADKMTQDVLQRRGGTVDEGQTTEQATSKFVATEFSKANQEIAKKIATKSLGTDVSKYAQTQDIIAKNLEKTKYDYARQSYEGLYGKGTDSDIQKWITGNQQMLEKDLYGMLTKEAVKSGIDFDKGSFYENFLAGSIEKQTPKDTRGFWQKAKDVGKTAALGIIDTPVGLITAGTDEVFGTDLYKRYFGGRTSLKADNKNFTDKVTNLLGEQMAWVDAAFGVGTFLTAGTGAPVFASLSASIKGGGKAIAKNIAKEGAEEVFQKSLREAFKNSGDDLVENLFNGVGKASIEDLAKKEGLDAVGYLQKIKGVMKETGKGVFQDGSRSSKDFYKAIDRFTDISGLGDVGKTARQNRWIESLSDGFGLPTQFIKMGTEGNVLQRLTTKSKGFSFMGVGLNVAIPGTTLLPGVGDWFETTGLRLGGALASVYVNNTRGGLIEVERKKFEQEYGVNPETTTDPKLKSQWQELIDYKLRHSLPSEILTGQTFSERNNSGQLLWGAFDAATNFAGVFGGIKAIGAGYGGLTKHLDPVGIKENGEMVSNLGFIQELAEIHRRDDIDSNQKQSMIEDLKSRVEAGSPDLVTTIRSAKELENAVKQMEKFEYSITNTQKNLLSETYSRGMGDVLAAMRDGDMNKAVEKLSQVNKDFSQVASNSASPAAMKEVNDKISVLDSYFKKVREDHSFVANVQKQFVVNLFTTNIKSPTGAIIRGNEDLVASAKSIYSNIEDIEKVMTDTYRVKGQYIMSRYADAGKPHVLDSRIAQMIEGTGIEPTKETISALRFPLVTALTKTQFEMKEFGDKTIDTIFDEVFSQYGSNIKARLDGNTEKTFADILEDLRMQDSGVIKSFSEKIENMMNDKIIMEKAKVDKHKTFLQENAMQIAQMDRLFSELTSNLTTEKSIERLENNPLTETKEVPVEEVILQVETEIRIKQENEEDVSAEKKNLEEMKEIQKENPESTILETRATDVKASDSPIVHKAVADDRIQTEISKENVEAKNVYLEELRQQKLRDETIARYEKDLLDAHKRINQGREKEALAESDIADMDANVSKEMDNFYKNEQRIRAYEDMFFRGISEEYNKSASRFFSRKGNLNFSSLKEFVDTKNYLLNKKGLAIYEEMKVEASKENPNMRAMKQRAKMLEGMIREKEIKDFSRGVVIEIAKKSNSAIEFEQNIRGAIRDTFRFTDEAIDSFMKGQFGDSSKIVPFYQLYKKQHKINAFRINLVAGEDGKLTADSFQRSEDTPEVFIDEFGNSTLWRLEGLGTAQLKEKFDIIQGDDITLNGKPLDSYWVNRGGEGKKNKKEYFRDNIMDGVIKEMENNGYIFLGDFQEEGKKKIFVKAKSGQGDWYDAMDALTGLNTREIEAIKDPDVKNQVMSNLGKYAKLIWWGEQNADIDTWKRSLALEEGQIELTQKSLGGLNGVDELIAALSVERGADVRHLLYDDKVDIDGEKEKMSDGRSYNLLHYTTTLNYSIGATSRNITHKTATLAGPGQFIKSKDILADNARFMDVPVVNALHSSTDPKIIAIVDFAHKNWGPEWYKNSEATKKVHEVIRDYRVIDRIVPMSAYKNIFTRNIKGEIPFEYQNYKPGEMLDVSLDKIGLKAIDEYKSPADRENETVKFSNQVTRNIHALEGFSQGEADIINDKINKIRTEDYSDLIDLAYETDNPYLVIKRIEERFGLKFNDYMGRDFITAMNAGNLEKFMSNIMKHSTTTGATIKGNQIDLTYPSNYADVRNFINNRLPENQKDNWIVLSKKFYGHLTGDRYMMFRYPVVADKVVNSPNIVWLEDINAGMGMDMYIGSSTIPSHSMIGRIEGDGDGDKIVLVTDPRMNDIQNTIDKFADTQKFTFKVPNMEANYHDPNIDLRNLWYETAYDTFEGKANIGMIDNTMSRVEKMIQMGFVLNNKPIINGENPFDKDSPFEGVMSKTQYLRAILGITLQRAVDNKTINLSRINEVIDSMLGVDIKLSAAELGFKTTRVVKGKDKDTTVNKKIILPKGDEVELWKIKMISTNKEVNDFLVAIARKSETGDYKLSEKEYEFYRKNSLTELKESMSKVESLMKKKNFLSDDEKSELTPLDARDVERKSVARLKKDYQEVYTEYLRLYNDYGDIIHRDPQMRFIRDSYPALMKDFPNLAKNLSKATSIIFPSIKNQFRVILDTETETGLRSLLDEYSIEKSKDKLIALEEKIYEYAEKHNIEDLDSVIIGKMSKPEGRLMNLLSMEGKQNLDKLLLDGFMFLPLHRIGIVNSSVDTTKLWLDIGKVDEESFKKTMAEVFATDEFQSQFRPAKEIFAEGKSNETIREMAQAGVHPLQFASFAEDIKNTPIEEREVLVRSMYDINDTDIGPLMEILKTESPEGWQTLLMGLGYKELSAKKLDDTARSAYDNVTSAPFNRPNC